MIGNTFFLTGSLICTSRNFIGRRIVSAILYLQVSFRNIKQLTDLLRQLSGVARTPGTRRAAAHAADAIPRGVVALSGTVNLP